jgi:hypothetical protein
MGLQLDWRAKQFPIQKPMLPRISTSSIRIRLEFIISRLEQSKNASPYFASYKRVC